MPKPKLRFPEFTSEWEYYNFEEILSIKNGMVSPDDYPDLPHIGPGNIEKETARLLDYNLAKDDNLISGKYLFDEDEIVYSKIRPNLMKVVYPRFKGLCSADAYPLKANQEYIIPDFLLYILLGKRFTKYAISVSLRTGMPKINREDLLAYTCAIPTTEEQKKIAKLLADIDKAIFYENSKLEAYTNQKKAIIQKLFNHTLKLSDASGASYPEWIEVPLFKILKERKTKAQKGGDYEHVSLTKDGVVPKTEQYDRDFLVKSDDKSYKITKLGDICYNPANLKFGVICRNKYKDGIFSPIYITFEIQKGFIPEFIEELVTRTDFINYALKYQEGTVYERMAVSPEDLLQIKVSVPCEAEQKQIAELLETYNKLIAVEREKISKYQDLKNGILQQMFI